MSTSTVVSQPLVKEFRLKTIALNNLDSEVKTIKKQLDTQRNARVQAANKLFKSMTAAERRVAVAKDVLAQLKARKIHITTGTYVQFPEDVNMPELDSDMQVCELTDTVKCDVCARGSMFLSACRLFDGVAIKDISGETDSTNELWYRAKGFKRQERRLFSGPQISLIETAFEREWMGNSIRIPKSDINAAIKFGKRYRGDKSRLIAIMTNIVRNKGEFVIPSRCYPR